MKRLVTLMCGNCYMEAQPRIETQADDPERALATCQHCGAFLCQFDPGWMLYDDTTTGDRETER